MPDASDLRELQFQDIARWRHADLPGRLAYAADDGREQELAALQSAPSALYAFVADEAVLYIGKTARSIRARFIGYRFPGRGQVTNIRCNQKIRELLDDGREVRILVLVPTSSLQWGSFALDLAAGLEESLIRHFQPPWNGSDRVSTETAELEEAATGPEGQGVKEVAAAKEVTRFPIRLQPTYFERGLLNPGTEASRLLGNDGDVVTIRLGREGTMVSRINRTANSNGSVRVVGNNALIADFFQRHFRPGDLAEGAVLDRATIELFEPGQ